MSVNLPSKDIISPDTVDSKSGNNFFDSDDVATGVETIEQFSEIDNWNAEESESQIENNESSPAGDKLDDEDYEDEVIPTHHS